MKPYAVVVSALNKKLRDGYAISHATIQTEAEGVGPAHEEAELYCALEAHQHGAGEGHDEHDHASQE